MDEERRIMEVNRLFYQALSDLDLQAMDGVWLHDAGVCCIHPDWPPLYGWEDVRSSWRRLFTDAPHHRVEPSQITVTVVGEVGWVTCLEHTSTASVTGETVTIAAAHHILVKSAAGWKLILRHASTIPVDALEPRSPQVH